jgi:hypothetical protein
MERRRISPVDLIYALISGIGSLLIMIMIVVRADFKESDPLLHYFFLFITISTLLLIITSFTFWIIRHLIRNGVIFKPNFNYNNPKIT